MYTEIIIFVLKFSLGCVALYYFYKLGYRNGKIDRMSKKEYNEQR